MNRLEQTRLPYAQRSQVYRCVPNGVLHVPAHKQCNPDRKPGQTVNPVPTTEWHALREVAA